MTDDDRRTAQDRTYGAINVRRKGADRRYVAATRFRDLDGQLRQVGATGSSRSAATSLLRDRLLRRPGYGSGGLLNVSSRFTDLAELWLADLELRDISEGTKENYRDDLRAHVMPHFDNYTLGEITTGRVEILLKAQAAFSYSRAKHSRTLLHQLSAYALRHDALA
ncbi:MAG TPA: hypothetical protein VHW64_08880 [Nocardioides sp.]|uniref:hypothetical protein n=1 Tax=Nocardioides sp. TaxID=35761 RepID=UPI002E319C3C|nr:hypothetical protein [Nocardioides sp.]HEX3930806.1 hypothetical protein [Nocardioides sp.]